MFMQLVSRMLCIAPFSSDGLTLFPLDPCVTDCHDLCYACLICDLCLCHDVYSTSLCEQKPNIYVLHITGVYTAS